MKLGIMQPYFLPYIGYWQLINAVDKYVIYDDVQYIKGGWINRNKILLNGRDFMFNLLIQGASPNKLINEIFVAENQSKLLKTIELSYKKAPMFETVFPLIENLLKYKDKNLAKYIGCSIINIANYLNIKTEFLYSSNIKEKDCSLKAQEKIINICSILKATEYINAIGGQELYDKSIFDKNGIKLFFLKTKPVDYIQFGNPYIANLSIVDVLMFNSVEQINEMLNNFEFI